MLHPCLGELAQWCCFWFSATGEICIEPEISDALRLNAGLWSWQEDRGHAGDLVVERREPALPEVMSCKMAWTWVVRNHELLWAYVCSDFSHFVTACDLHPGKSHSTLWSHCTWRHLPSAQQCPKFPLEGSLWPVPEIQPSSICLQKNLKHGFEIRS